MKLIPNDLIPEIRLRIDSIKKHMTASGLDAVLVATSQNIYYTSLRIFRGFVYIPSEGEPVWFVVRPDIYDHDSSIEIIRKPEMILPALAARGYKAPAKIGLEYDSMSYSEIERLKAAFPDSAAGNGSKVMALARMVKTDWEIARIKEDAMHQAEVYRRVVHCYKENMTDLELQIEIERVMRLEGCLGYTRTAGNSMEINMGSLIAGDNADSPSPFDFSMGGTGVDPALPVGANGTTLKPGETVMVDMSGAFNGYQSDMTRVWRIGEISPLAQKAHQCSCNILRACEKLGKPGVNVSELYREAVMIADGEGLGDYFMGHTQKAKFIGHGIGIELNELPVVMERSPFSLEKGMVIALEPKFVIPGTGAVGIENTYVVTESGLETLTVFPDEINEL